MEQDLLYSEAEVMRILNLSKEELARLRKKGLPYVKFSSRCRAYFKNDILDFGKQNRIVFGVKKPETSQGTGLN